MISRNTPKKSSLGIEPTLNAAAVLPIVSARMVPPASSEEVGETKRLPDGIVVNDWYRSLNSATGGRIFSQRCKNFVRRGNGINKAPGIRCALDGLG